MKVHIRTGSARKTPKEGDRRTTKRHGLQIRVWVRAKDSRGRPFAAVVSKGRPVYEWRKPQHLDAWDLHLLTADERAAMAAERKP